MKSENHIIKIFRDNGGQLRMSDAIRLGISRYRLYSLVQKNIIEKLSRGIYRLVELPPLSQHDMVTVSLRFPSAVVCLTSALSFHELTTQIPRQISIAIPRGTRPPVLDFPPIEVHSYSAGAYQSGIEEHMLDNVAVKVYSAEKTLVDCIKFRNKLGMDIVLEAIKIYGQHKKVNYDKLIEYAEVCRVKKIIQPYLETLR
ncbi:MAG: transcriptional regulator [Legionellales bacterium]|nr:transcriptional regulator [Legionellales bacterium]|tara:strand:+ start:1133 stop:1732 length:600 start_codon:yes stop_codon:yes gene_type:complete